MDLPASELYCHQETGVPVAAPIFKVYDIQPYAAAAVLLRSPILDSTFHMFLVRFRQQPGFSGYSSSCE